MYYPPRVLPILKHPRRSQARGTLERHTALKARAALKPHTLPSTRSVQISRPQQKHPAAAHRNLGPDERHPWKGAQQRVLGIADFDDQDAVAAEMLARRREYRSHRIEAVGTRGKAESWFVPILAR